MSDERNDGLPEHGFVKLGVVQKLMGISRATLDRGIRDGSIPAPVHITKKCLGWPVEVIRDFFDGKRREQQEMDELIQLMKRP